MKFFFGFDARSFLAANLALPAGLVDVNQTGDVNAFAGLLCAAYEIRRYPKLLADLKNALFTQTTMTGATEPLREFPHHAQINLN
ncbi:MAG: hypothetical protein M3525_11485 [Acidobacteriota bacterium]|nr:hypothetical protein [Acidobacteriota bacterium]